MATKVKQSIIVKERSYELVEVLGPGDEIIALKTPKNRSKWLAENEKPNVSC